MDEVSQSLHTLLEVKELEVSFMNQDGKKKVVDQISFSVEEGELLGIVGESGSGKSMTALAILGLLKEKAIVEKGSIFFNGRDLLQLDLEELRKIKGSEISMIFQEPMTSLNPLQRVGKQIEDLK